MVTQNNGQAALESWFLPIRYCSQLGVSADVWQEVYYYWSPTLDLSLSILSVCFYLLLSASSFSLHLSRYLISLYRLWSVTPPTHLLSFCPLRSISLHPPAFSVHLDLSFSEDALYGFEEYNPLPHPPPLRKPWADTRGSVRPKRSPTAR